MLVKKGYLLVIGGGSTTVDGPKNDGISLEVVTGVFRSPLLLLLLASLTFVMEFCCVTLGRLSVGWPLDVIIVADAVMIEVVDELLLQLLDAILLLVQFFTDALFETVLLLLLLELFSDVLLLLLLLLFELLLFDEIVVAADG